MVTFKRLDYIRLLGRNGAVTITNYKYILVNDTGDSLACCHVYANLQC